MKEKITLHCYCCHQPYQRGHFRCCAPPSGMASHKWLEQFCRVELSPGKFCGKCPRCGCEHRTAPKVTGLEIGMTAPGDLVPKTHGELRALVAKAAIQKPRERKEWMPYRENREPGSDDE